MVSKGKILRKSSLVLITVGTTPFPFPRLLKTVDKTLLERPGKIKVVVQTGAVDYVWHYKQVELYSYIRPPKLISFIKSADKIISHAGPATIYLIAKYASNMPLIVPRLKTYGEHVDNHQLQFTKFMHSKLPPQYRSYFHISGDLSSHLRTYLFQKGAKNSLRLIFQNAQPRKLLIEKMRRYIDTIA